MGKVHEVSSGLQYFVVEVTSVRASLGCPQKSPNDMNKGQEDPDKDGGRLGCEPH